MALLAQERAAYLQHAIFRSAVRIMTNRAILAHRRVLPQERTALFGVALIAGFVHRVLGQLRSGGRAVRIVAVGTDHLGFPYGMAGALETLRPLILMAGEADFCLGLLGQDRVIHADRVMAVDAGVASRGVRADMPIHPDGALGVASLA